MSPRAVKNFSRRFFQVVLSQEWLMRMNVPQNVRAFQTVGERQPFVVQQFNYCAVRENNLGGFRFRLDRRCSFHQDFPTAILIMKTVAITN
jgi:hypothetical protein